MTHFNGLTPAEDERLAVLSEECAETIMAIEKIRRHGYESHNPDSLSVNPSTNRLDLEKEIGHVWNAVSMLRKAGDLSYFNMAKSQENKAKTIGKYLHHQPGYEGFCGS